MDARLKAIKYIKKIGKELYDICFSDIFRDSTLMGNEKKNKQIGYLQTKIFWKSENIIKTKIYPTERKYLYIMHLIFRYIKHS